MYINQYVKYIYINFMNNKKYFIYTIIEKI